MTQKFPPLSHRTTSAILFLLPQTQIRPISNHISGISPGFGPKPDADMRANFLPSSLHPVWAAEATGAGGSRKILKALSLYGDVKYKPDFDHFDYANPKAPKGGLVRMGWDWYF